MQSAFRIEIYRYLEVLEAVKTVYLKLHITKKLVFTVISDCLNVLRRIDLTNRVIIISTSIHGVIREILMNKKDYFSFLHAVKVAVYQD